ncbi:Retrovirus-related Pol polyprotein from transposon 297 [Vitis vinifera]|uniref:Retrovirus-related Pol polyprotein from transposon 297 n=1 Tax=Vitis vinifera TaxID=29760 RepID=A0A438CE68_VITVI|nr:Retrovirus-related Pol polyprotein from transposon 297 [Vitis vinifera]
MTRRLEELELKKMHEVQAVAETPVQVKPCPICQSYEHLVEECPTIPAAREMFGDQANVIGQFKPNNNASYGNTYNSSWRNHPNFLGSQEHLSTTASSTISTSFNLEQAIVNLSKIDNLQYSISRLTNLNTVQEKGRFPSQPHQNPKGIHEVETHEENLHRGLNVNKKAFLTEQVSAIIQCKSPLKYKDPGCPTISVMIGGKVVEKALLDLGASVNLLPYSVYKQLGLGELKPTSITLSLADRSVKIPRGIIEDVLVQVDNFYYPVDFVVLDTDPLNGLMQLTFGNMTLSSISLYVKKLITPEEEEGPEEVCIIDTLVEEHCNQNMQDKLNESLGDLEEGLPEPSMCLLLYKVGGGEKRFYLCSIKRRHKKLLKKRPQSSIEASAHGVEIYIPGRNKQCPVVISSSLTTSGSVYLKFSRGEEAKPIRQPQRRLNPHLQEVVRGGAEATSSRYYLPISDSPWVSPTQVCWRESLAILSIVSWTVLRYFQIEIDVEDQEKTTFTCPFGTYAYRRMPFGLCNAPATFQRCMLSIFSDMVERIMEVFMDDITIYGGTFEECLVNLEAVLNRCIEKDLVLNWEKCHFMVHQGIVLGHIISEKGIEVDKAKVELIVKLPSPTTVKGVRQFLGHAGFYRSL